MPATITYDDGSGATASNPRTFAISDAMLAVLEQFRLSITEVKTGGERGPVYPTIPDLFRGFLNSAVMTPAIRAFPPAAIATAQQAVAAAQTDLQSLVLTLITTGLQG